MRLQTASLYILFSVVLTILSFTLRSQIVINEYSASNLSDFTDNYNKYEDWAEIYNAGSETVNLESFSLSDSPGNPDKWVIPSGIEISPGEHIKFWLSGRDEVSGTNYHTNFKLTQTKDNTESILIADPDGIILDQMQLEITQLGHSRGRVQDGSTIWGIFTSPTPGSSNDTETSFLRYAESCLTSIEPGFYSGSVSVILTTDETDAEIRYTTNGDIPTASSGLYTGPVNINSTSILKAKVFSNNPDILPGLISFNTYFINEEHTLPVISVSSNTLDELLNGNQTLMPFGTAEYFNQEGVRTTFGYGEFNKHGQDSWVNDQRSIDYITRDECGYNYALREKLLTLSTRDEFQRVILRAAGDDNYPGIDTSAHLRDMFIQKLSNKNNLNLDVRKAERCVMYANGTYWGVYSIREKVDDHDYTKYYYDQGKYDIQFLMLWGTTWAEYGGDKAFTDWNNLHDYIMNNDMSNQSDYEFVESQLNVASLVDYVLINSYVVCSDWLNWNVGWWRGLDPAGGHKKWGYILWDNDATFGHYINYTGVPAQDPFVAPCFHEFITQSWQDPEGHIAILNKLRENSEFDQYYISRYADLMNTTLYEDSVLNLLNSIAMTIEPEMTDHINRWGGNYLEWQQNVADIENFIITRNSIMNNGLIDCYDLSGPYQITFEIEPPGAGEIQVNSVIPEYYPWEANYFGGIDLKLEAIETESEWEFQSWSLDNHTPSPSSTDEEITIDLISEDIITAHFVPRLTFDSLVINEINYNSHPDFDTDDWVEFYNPHGYEINLSNWVFKDEDDLHQFIFPDGTIIEANGYLVLCSNSDAFTSLFPDVDNYIGDMSFGLSGSGELLRLYDNTGILTDSVLYDDKDPWPEDPDGNGPTLELISPDFDNALAASWSNCESHGTPGEENCSSNIAEIETKHSLKVFPNPVKRTGILSIETEYTIHDYSIEIMNSSGKPVMYVSNINSEQITFSKGSLVPGLYFCVLYDKDNNPVAQSKFVIL
jgi:hypothetical protein